MKNAKIFLAFLFVFSVILFFGLKNVLAEDCENIPSDSANINHKIECLNNKLSQLSQAASTLNNQIAQFNAQISLTTLKITETQDKIDLLGGRISTLETSLTDLTKSFSARALATYMMARGNEPIFLLLSASNVPDALAKFHYLEKIQGADYDLLVRLQTAQDNYKSSKQDSEDLQKELQTQKTALSSQKTAKAQLLADTKGSETKYQALLSAALAELASFSSFVDSQGGASLLSGQTSCDGWGCYYNQRDRQWEAILINGRNDCEDSKGNIIPCTMARFGCLVTSVAMVASHMGHREIMPSDIAVSSGENFQVNTAMLKYPISVKGLSLVRNKVSLDSAIQNGPVIVGIYAYGGTHFVVIKSGSNGNYVMNDPFIPNGKDKNFTSYYSVSNIYEVNNVVIN